MTAERIVVGVDTSAAARAAVAWAAGESARRRYDTLLLVHAPTTADDSLIRRYGEPAILAVDSDATQLLDRLTVYAATLEPSIAVFSRIAHAHAAEALVDLSHDAELVVVGTRGTGSLSTMLGSVSRHVAAHAHCPVAVVPERPTLRPAAIQQGDYVVTGVWDSYAGRMALRYAFDEARLHGSGIVAVLSMPEPVGADTSASEARRDPMSVLAAAIEPFRTSHPDVSVSPMALSVDPGEALLEAAQHARMIVLGCHHSDDNWSTRLGPVTSTVLHRTPCPVIVIGHRDHSSSRP